jgi:tetratricopeptide (TPR) repeat protein
MKPEEFDKQFLAWLDQRTKKAVDGFDEWRGHLKDVAVKAKAKDWDAVIQEGTAIRDIYSDYVETGSVYEFLSDAYLAKGDKAKAIAELERYAGVGGRDPSLLKHLSSLQAEAGNKRAAAKALERLNLIYLKDEEAHKKLGELYMELNNPSGAAREYAAVLAGGTVDQAGAHYQLARALQAAKRTDDARNEVLSALEIAPGFKPAQKLLLELNPKEK